MLKLKKVIPNLLTLLNMTCGILSIFLSSSETTRIYAAYLILLAMVFDFLDGFAARILKSGSATGKELDSLSDMVSFGIAPSILLMYTINDINISYTGNVHIWFLKSLLLIIPALTALRLARFNLDERQKKHFIGLPTPANALFLAALYFIQIQNALPSVLNIFRNNPVAITIAAISAASLLNCNLLMFSMKLNFASKKLFIIQLTLTGFAVAMFIFFSFAAIPAVFLFYILLSVFFKRFFDKD